MLCSISKSSRLNVIPFLQMCVCLLSVCRNILRVHLLFPIGMEPVDESLLKEPPRDPNEGILNKDFLTKLVYYGLLIAVATMTSFYIGMETSTQTAVTMAFATLTLARLFHGFNCRGKASIFKLGLTSNKWTILAFFTGVVLLGIVLLVPVMERLFEAVALTSGQLGMVVLMAFAPTLIIQIVKVILDARRK